MQTQLMRAPPCAATRRACRGHMADVEKMHKFFSQTAYYEMPQRGGTKVKRRSVLPSANPSSLAGKDLDKLQFCIVHYAGKVTYTAESWLDKNRGFLQPELAFLAELALCTPLPAGWEAQRDAAGKTSYRNTITNVTVAKHPLQLYAASFTP